MGRSFWLACLVLAVVVGCDSRDKELVDLAQRGTEQQASQNQEMSRLNREVAEGSRRLVENNQQLVTFQRELQSERRDLANQHRQDSLLAEAIGGFVTLLVCALPLVAVVWLLGAALGEKGNDAVAEVLIEDITSDVPITMNPQHANPQVVAESAHLSLPRQEDADQRA